MLFYYGFYTPESKTRQDRARDHQPAGVSLQSSHVGDRVGFDALRAQIGSLSRRRREPWLHPRRNAEAVWVGRQSPLLDRHGLRGYRPRPAALWVRVSIKR